MENRNGIILDAEMFQANGTAEGDAAVVMLERIPDGQRATVAGDKGYDTKDFVAESQNLQVTPHVAQNEKRCGGSAIDGRTTRHAGYGVFTFAAAAYKLVRVRTLLLPAAQSA